MSFLSSFNKFNSNHLLTIDVISSYFCIFSISYLINFNKVASNAVTLVSQDLFIKGLKQRPRSNICFDMASFMKSMNAWSNNASDIDKNANLSCQRKIFEYFSFSLCASTFDRLYIDIIGVGSNSIFYEEMMKKNIMEQDCIEHLWNANIHNSPSLYHVLLNVPI